MRAAAPDRLRSLPFKAAGNAAAPRESRRRDAVKPVGVLGVLALTCGLLSSLTSVPPAAAAERAHRGLGETVVLTTGVRMNVRKAELIDGRYQLDLLDGGRVWLPASLIARIAPLEGLGKSDQSLIAARRSTVTNKDGQVIPPARLPRLQANPSLEGLPMASPETATRRPGMASPLNPNHRVGVRGAHPVNRRSTAEARETQYQPGRGKMAELLRRMNRGGQGNTRSPR